jgi:hypothetical protein
MVKMDMFDDLAEAGKGLGVSRALLYEPPPGSAPRGASTTPSP